MVLSEKQKEARAQLIKEQEKTLQENQQEIIMLVKSKFKSFKKAEEFLRKELKLS